MLNIKTLDVGEVLNIYERLVVDASHSEDPISPYGVKSQTMLESAVSRQHTSFGETYKYGDAISNAATLCYGICCNHPFHNGNKRTALVALMCHLDKNNLTFSDRANQNLLYGFMLKVASHKILETKKLRKAHDQSDAEIKAMADWIRKKSRKVEKGERTLSYPELEKILRAHNIYFVQDKNSYVDLVKKEIVTKKKGLFRKEKVEVERKIANIPHWPGRSVGKNLIKSIRQKANLTARDGVDSALFYGEQSLPDDFIQKYKKTLAKLAKT